MGLQNIIQPIGVALQSPLQGGLSILAGENLDRNLTQTVAQLALAILFPVWAPPLFLLWFIGRTISWIREGSQCRVNLDPAALSRKPAPIQIPEENLDGIDFSDLLGFYDEKFSGWRISETRRRPKLEKIISLVSNSPNPELKQALKWIIKKLKTGQLNTVEQERIIQELANSLGNYFHIIRPEELLRVFEGIKKSFSSILSLCDKVDQHLGLSLHQKDSLKQHFRQIDEEYHRGNSSAFDNDLFFYLEKIMEAMGRGHVTPNQEEDIFICLSDGFSACPPTWMQVASTKYKEVYGLVQAPEDKLLHALQSYKEACILELIQVQDDNSQWHGLNKFRQLYGDELGLDTSTMQHDRHAFLGNPESVKRRWLQMYQDPNRLITAVHMRVVSEKINDDSLGMFLGRIGEENGVEDPTDWEYLGQFYDGEGVDLSLNKKGIETMLKHMRILR